MEISSFVFSDLSAEFANPSWNLLLEDTLGPMIGRLQHTIGLICPLVLNAAFPFAIPLRNQTRDIIHYSDYHDPFLSHLYLLGTSPWNLSLNFLFLKDTTMFWSSGIN